MAPDANVECGLNDEIIPGADVVILAVRDRVQREHVKEIAGVLGGKIVVSMANPLRVKDGVVTYLHPPEGSLAEEVQRDAPGSRVVSAFHEISLSRFAKVDEVIDSDTIVCSDDEEAKKIVARLARDLGLRPVDAGPLSNSRYVEAYTTVLISINLRYGSSTSVRITGLPE